MSLASLGLPPDLQEYLLAVGIREPEILRRLRQETAQMPERNMQIAPEQGALMALLVELIGARRCVELGTFTGYSSLAVALALPDDGKMICCDISETWTSVARRYWAEAGVAHKFDLRLGPALDTLRELLRQGTAFDFAFMDADKANYPTYLEILLRLVRPGGLIAVDNVFWAGEVLTDADDPDTRGVRELNRILATDDRVSIAMIPVADGLTLARVRG